MSAPEKITIDYHGYKLDDHDLASVKVERGHYSGVNVHIADGRSETDGPTYAMPRFLQEYTEDPLNQLRDKVLAEALKARIIGIDLPGIGIDKGYAKTPISQKWEAAVHGNIGRYANLQVKALKEVLGEDEKEATVNFLGYSLGVHAAVAMRMSEELANSSLTVESMHLVEAVNDQEWPSINRLFKAIMKEDEATNRYLLETHKLGLGITAYDRSPEDPTQKLKDKSLPRRLDSVAVALGMRRGFAEKFAQFKENHSDTFSNAPITIYRANGSGIARPEANEQTADTLGARFVELRPPENDPPHQHAIWLSMGAVGVLAAKIAEYHREG